MHFELLGVLAEHGDRAAVAAMVPKLVARVRATRQAGSVELAQDLSQVCMALVQCQQWAAAEPLLRELLAVREAKIPGAWQIEFTRSQLGLVQLGLGRFADAEALLVAGAEGMLARQQTMPPAARVRVREAVSRVVDLYMKWGEAEATPQRVELAAKWRERLGALPSGGR
jgi:hypothetical protein